MISSIHRNLFFKVKATFDRLIDLTGWIASVGIAFITVSVGFEVIFRYLTGHAHLWVLEFSEYSLLIVTLLGGAWVLRRGEHIKVDWLFNLLNPRQKSIFNICINIAGAAITFIVSWYGLMVCIDDYQTSAVFNNVLRLPRAPIISVIPIGCFILAVQSLRLVYQEIRKLRKL